LSQHEPGPISRPELGAITLAVLLSAIALIALWLTGWGVPTTPSGELMRDSFQLVIAGLAGSLAGLLVVWAFTDRRAILLAAAVVGLLPAITRATAIFTGAY
jgi:hypothetical protein